MKIEDYALIGDTRTAALVGRDGSIDWWCVPRFDSGACFAALLGDSENGRWLLRARGQQMGKRRYVGDSLILETEWETSKGCAWVTDHMPIGDHDSRIVRIVEGISGSVSMEMEMIVRFDYGHVVPWVRRQGDGSLTAIGGPDRVVLHTPIETAGEHMTTRAQFTVRAGDRVPFTLAWHPSHEPPGKATDPERDLAATTKWWRQWCKGSKLPAARQEWHGAVARSLITLKALTYSPTGGIVAAPTTSLPEKIGGVRNWDYRFCWLRDATFTLYALLLAGYETEAVQWRDWLLRAVAGEPKEFQILYGPGGERRLPEYEVPWLTGYESSSPVRVGNQAAEQFQLDVFGEVMDTLSVARRHGFVEIDTAWDMQRALVDELESVWHHPDDGIWEVRGPRRHFVHSKVMAWVAVDRALQGVEHGYQGPVRRWRALRRQIHEEVCREGFDTDIGSFTQYYGSTELDASVLMIPLVGFLPPTDQRVRSTIDVIQRQLLSDGLVMRYSGAPHVDGLPPGEGAFLPCSFWLADALAMAGRMDEAEALFERLLSLANDVGLLAEEYDVGAHRLVGNFPQAFSHLSLVNTADNLSPALTGPSRHRSS